MRLLATENGLVATLSHSEQGLFMKLVHPTKFTTRQVFERVVEVWSANLEQDIMDALAEMEEEANGNEN